MSSIHISAFHKSVDSHGGSKRSLQLQSRARERGSLVVGIPIAHDLLKYFIQHPRYWIQSLFNVVRISPYVNLKGLAIGYIYSVWLRGLLHKERPNHLHIEVCSGKYLVYSYLAATSGVPVIAYPHNIEFMVPGQDLKFLRSKLAAQSIELSIYRRSSLVNTISSLDLFILKCFSLENIRIYPYEPTNDEAIWLKMIKNERALINHEGFLILGSASNMATRLGMIKLLSLIKSSSKKRKYYLAGYETDSLAAKAPSNLTIYGPVSKSRLRELMTQCKALLINQPPTTGMLTRIIEAEYADIPVFIFNDYIQAYTLCSPNVHIISSLDELPLEDD